MPVPQKYQEQAEVPRDSPRKSRQAEYICESPRESQQKKPEQEEIRSSPRNSQHTREQPEVDPPRKSLPPPAEIPASSRPPSHPQRNHDKSCASPKSLGNPSSPKSFTSPKSLGNPSSPKLLISKTSFASTVNYPPALGLAGSTIEQFLSPPNLSWAPTSDQPSIMYHPPVNNETDSEAESEVDRYLAAMDNRICNASQSTTFGALSLETTETDLTGKNSSLTSSTFGAFSLFGTNVSAGDERSSNNKQRSIGRSSIYKERSCGLLSSMDSEATSQNLLVNNLQELAEDDYFRVKQSFGYFATGILAIQLCVLMLQLALCGVAPLDVNPVVGPYPDAFSEWGGKNAYLLLEGREYWRFVTPAFLHVGVLHLLCNAVVQLETCAFFEREWGSKRWIIIYILSEVGCVVVSCVVNPDTLAVGSSGAMMGLFGAKFAQLITNTIFELVASYQPHVRTDQLSGIMCSLFVISILSFLTYVDWSGHVGGFATGFCVGMVAFSTPIRSSAKRFLWNVIGLGLLGTGAYYSFQALFMATNPDEDLADPCYYFRYLHAEGYNCECGWG